MENKNYSFVTKRELPIIENNSVVDGYNLTQMLPHTPIFTGVRGLTFVRCNLTNCDVPVDAVIDDCLHLHKSLCAHIHPEFVNAGLPEEVDNCPHVIDTDTIAIDGVVVDTVYHRKDIIL